jgi:hypothetical protein
MLASLDRVALAGAQAGTDPGPLGPALDQAQVSIWYSIWAENVSALGADDAWVYDDGPNSGNLDCRPGHMTGCWGHRDAILTTWGSTNRDLVLVAGAAEAPVHLEFGTGGSYTELIAVITRAKTSPNYVYTWAQARSAGAS